ncbi:MAG: hypothetical protein ACK5LO_02685 [Leucobacter sp.]
MFSQKFLLDLDIRFAPDDSPGYSTMDGGISLFVVVTSAIAALAAGATFGKMIGDSVFGSGGDDRDEESTVIINTNGAETTITADGEEG